MAKKYLSYIYTLSINNILNLTKKDTIIKDAKKYLKIYIQFWNICSKIRFI